MIELDLVQGSQEWLDARFKYRCASEAPVMMRASSKMTRNELIHIKATGDQKEFSEWVQRNLFDKGHEYEALARPIAEEIIGEELYPVTATDDEGYLLASFDGLTMSEDIILEHKMLNAGIIECVNNRDLLPENYWQLEQQLLVSGAEYCLFAVSNGTKDNFVSMKYYPVPGRAEQLIAGWKQFDEDEENYNPPVTKVVTVGLAPENLPALHIEVTGMVTASNIEKYTNHALAVFGAVNTDLESDKDFADAEKTVKWCKGVESKLEAAKQNALGQTATIDDLFRSIDSIKDEARTVRLNLEKLVKNQKIAIRGRILKAGKEALSNHIGTVNSTLGKLCLPTIPFDFAAAMKGKKAVTSLQSAVDDELARAKIEANRIGDIIRVNILELQVLAKGYEFLFVDAQQLVLKNNDDLKNLINARVAEHKKVEEEKRLAEEKQAKEKLEEEKAILDANKLKILCETAAMEDGQKKPSSTSNRPIARPDPKPASEYVPQNDTSYGMVYTGKPSERVIVKRPTNIEIIQSVASHFAVDPGTAFKWISEIDFSEYASTRS